MQLTSQEEYGLRCLLRLAQAGSGTILSLHEISQGEAISIPHAAKLMRVLREGGLVVSERGQAGGYQLSRSPDRISAKEALQVLGGDFYGGEFCGRFSGNEDLCTHTIDCSIRSLWARGAGSGRPVTEPYKPARLDVQRARNGPFRWGTGRAHGCDDLLLRRGTAWLISSRFRKHFAAWCTRTTGGISLSWASSKTSRWSTVQCSSRSRTLCQVGTPPRLFWPRPAPP